MPESLVWHAAGMLLFCAVTILQSNSCNLHGIEYVLIGHLESLDEDMATVMRNTNLPTESVAAARKFFTTKSIHATNSLAETAKLYKNKVSGNPTSLSLRSSSVCLHASLQDSNTPVHLCLDSFGTSLST